MILGGVVEEPALDGVTKFRGVCIAFVKPGNGLFLGFLRMPNGNTIPVAPCNDRNAAMNGITMILANNQSLNLNAYV